MKRLPILALCLMLAAGIRAQESPSNSEERFDVALVRCSNAIRSISISVPDSFKVNGCDDTISVTHPNAIFIPEGLYGFRVWCVFSVTSGLHCDENSFLRVSNDGQTWVRFPGCPDPLSWKSDFVDSSEGTAPLFASSSYASDPDLFFGSNGELWVITRAFFETGGSRAALYARCSVDGVTWSSNRRISEFVRGDASLLSPAVFHDSSGPYTMWSVLYGNEADGKVRGRIEIRQASAPDAVWTLVDTVRQNGTGQLFPSGKDTAAIGDDSIWTGQYSPWHVGLVDDHEGNKIILLTAKNSGRIDREHPAFVDFIGVTRDGRSMSLREEPLLKPSFVRDSPDSQYVYKATGWVETRDGQSSLKVLYSGKATRYWHTALTSSDLVPRKDTIPADTSALFVRRTH